jgi:D-citramalate synthase
MKESSLYTVSSRDTGYRIPANKPIVGDNFLLKLLVFTLTEIIKQLVFQRFYRTIWQKTSIRFRKTSGRLILKKSSRTRIKAKCGRFKISYPRILNWETKETVTREDLPYIISDVLDSQTYQEKIVVESVCIITR